MIPFSIRTCLLDGLSFLAAAFAVAAICATALGAAGNGRVLLHEDFAGPQEDWGVLPTGWWLEGEASGSRARVDDGRLVLDAMTGSGRGATLWLDRELPDDIELSFDVHVLDAIKQANNMNLLLGFRKLGEPNLRETRGERSDGRYRLYHSGDLTGIIVTYLANGDPEEARLRVRQVPPFNPVAAEFNGYHARRGHTYRFAITRRGDQLTCVVDGRLLLDVTLPPREDSTTGGYLGFRTWNTLLWWDNLVIRELSPQAD